MNWAGLISSTAHRSGWSDRPLYLTDGQVWSHGDVHSLAGRLATVLADLGVGPGGRVLVALPDRPELVATFLAVGRLGAVAVVVNPALIAADLTALEAHTRPALVISEPDQEAAFDPLSWKDIDHLVGLAGGAVEGPTVAVDPATALYVQFTSGTTGTPKGAVHRHADMAAYHRAVGLDMLAISSADVTLSISKMFFAYGFGNSLVYPVCSGSAAVLTRARATPKMVAELVDEFSVTILHAVPSAYANLVAEADENAFATIRVAVSAGESLPNSIGSAASALVGAEVLNELGSTEVGGAFCSNVPGDNSPGTVGRPLRGYDLAIRDGVGSPVASGTEGRLWVRGPTVMAGYLDRPVESADVLRDGWLCTNDTAYQREDGRFVHTGRVDDVELVGGINVCPHEVEAVLVEHPAVREVVVAAVPDQRGATKLRAFVVPNGEVGRPAVAEAELLDLARSRLSPFKIPRSVSFVDALPRTFTGKVQRFKARQGAW